jgi:uncharacterized membrane protein
LGYSTKGEVLRKTAVALVVGALVLGLLVTGCGGSSSQDATAQEVNALCLASNKKAATAAYKVLQEQNHGPRITEREGIQRSARTLIPILVVDAEAQVDAVGSLEVPSGDEAQVKAIISAYRAWIDKAKKTPVKIVYAGDNFEKPRELAEKYGLAECAVNPLQEPNFRTLVTSS